MSQTITASLQRLARHEKNLDKLFFTCTAVESPHCTKKGFGLIEDEGVCDLCQKHREARAVVEKEAYWFIE